MDIIKTEDLVKMVFVVRKDLKMGIGKVAAQVSHAAVNIVLTLQHQKEEEILIEWVKNIWTKIVLKCDSEEELLRIHNEAKNDKIVTLYITDAGKTQIDPGSKTVLVMLGKCKELDKIVGKLKLL